jgi:hypothetical protein
MKRFGIGVAIYFAGFIVIAIINYVVLPVFGIHFQPYAIGKTVGVLWLVAVLAAGLLHVY